MVLYLSTIRTYQPSQPGRKDTKELCVLGVNVGVPTPAVNKPHNETLCSNVLFTRERGNGGYRHKTLTGATVKLQKQCVPVNTKYRPGRGAVAQNP